MRLYTQFRQWLWRKFDVALPALPGWEARIQHVVDVGGHHAPVEWSLARRVEGEEDRYEILTATCAQTGRAISGATPQKDGQFDLSAWGVRCARCGVPLHNDQANMQTSLDIPSCRVDKKAVRRAAHS